MWWRCTILIFNYYYLLLLAAQHVFDRRWFERRWSLTGLVIHTYVYIYIYKVHEDGPSGAAVALTAALTLRPVHSPMQQVEEASRKITDEFRGLENDQVIAFPGLAASLTVSTLVFSKLRIGAPDPSAVPPRGHLETREADLSSTLRAATAAAEAAKDAVLAAHESVLGFGGRAERVVALLFRDWREVYSESVAAAEVAGLRPRLRRAREVYRASKRFRDETAGRLRAVRALREAPWWGAPLMHPRDEGACDAGWNLGFEHDGKARAAGGRFCAFCASLAPPLLSRHTFVRCPRRHAAGAAEWDAPALERQRGI
jgi:hypothetical protein